MRKFILAALIVLSVTMGFDALALAPVTASPWTTTTNPYTARTGLVVYSTSEVNALITAATNGLATTNYAKSVTNNFTALVYTNPSSILYTSSLPALTNGFVTSSITNGLATTNYVNAATNGLVTSSITNGLATTNYVNSITNGLATTNYVLTQISATNTANLTITTNLVVAATNNFTTLVYSNPAVFLYTNALPGLTNGFVTSSITNGLATTNYVNSITNGLATTNYVNAATNGFVTSSVTNGFATIGYVSAITNGLATTNYVLNQGFVTASVTNGLATTNFVLSSISASNANLGTTSAVNMTNAANRFTATNLTVSNIQPGSSGNLNINAGSGNISANTFSGNGPGLNNLNGANIQAATITSNQISSINPSQIYPPISTSSLSNFVATINSTNGYCTYITNAGVVTATWVTTNLPTSAIPNLAQFVATNSTGITSNYTGAVNLTNSANVFMGTISGSSSATYGVSGYSTATYGVYGNSSASYGVYGNSSADVGVAGRSSVTYGVYGNSSGDVGVFGNSTVAEGVYGNSFATNKYGVYGNSIRGHGVWSDGDLKVTTSASFAGGAATISTSGVFTGNGAGLTNLTSSGLVTNVLLTNSVGISSGSFVAAGVAYLSLTNPAAIPAFNTPSVVTNVTGNSGANYQSSPAALTLGSLNSSGGNYLLVGVACRRIGAVANPTNATINGISLAYICSTNLEDTRGYVYWYGLAFPPSGQVVVNFNADVNANSGGAAVIAVLLNNVNSIGLGFTNYSTSNRTSASNGVAAASSDLLLTAFGDSIGNGYGNETGWGQTIVGNDANGSDGAIEVTYSPVTNGIATAAWSGISGIEKLATLGVLVHGSQNLGTNVTATTFAGSFTGNGSGLTSITAGQVGAQPTNVNLTTLATLNGGSLTNLNALNITNLAATIGAQVGSSNYLTSASSLNYTKLTNAPTITTNYLVTIGSTNGYSTYVTNANGSIAATFVFTNLAGLSVAASAVTGTLTNNTTGSSANTTNLVGASVTLTGTNGASTASFTTAGVLKLNLQTNSTTSGGVTNGGSPTFVNVMLGGGVQLQSQFSDTLEIHRGDNSYPSSSLKFYDGNAHTLGGIDMDDNNGLYIQGPVDSPFVYLVDNDNNVANLAAGSLWITSGGGPNYGQIPPYTITAGNSLGLYDGTSYSALFGANGNLGVGTASPMYSMDVNGHIGNSAGNFDINSASGEYNFNSADNNPTYTHINLVTQGGAGQCAVNFYTYGGSSISCTPAATWKFTDNGNYAGQNIFYSAIGGSSTSGQRPLLGIGAGTSANTVQGVGIGTDYAVGQLLPNNGLAVEGFTGIGTLTPKAQLDVAGASHFSSYMTNDANIYVAGSVNEAAKDLSPHLTTSASTSGTVTAATGYWNETIYLSSGSTITSITIALPSSSTLVGQIYRVHTKSIVTTLSVTGGSFVDAAVITLTAGQTIAYQAQSTSGAYIRIQ
jgi:hypothetical protein